ncbi:MAG TPA: hypothetical protein VF503_21325 [Sphingobium sp.]|uniref:hypothetical protein n=1 Tax=Sphingobium sp. TaxID=1912891 RepID=UPI002ED55D7B
MSDLLQLAARVEDAVGPSLVLDRDIALALYPRAAAIPGNEARILVWDGNGRTHLTVKPYTALLDAAMTLRLEGWHVSMMTECDQNDSAAVCLTENEEPCRDVVGRGVNMITSLIAACLRAREVTHG